MAVVQSTYTSTIEAAVAGLIANMETSNTVTRLCEDSAGLGFGVAVFQGTADNEVTATTGTAFIGITVKDVTVVNDAAAEKYPQASNVAVMTQGVIWGETGGAVNAGVAVHVDTAGKFVESEADSVALPGAVFETSGADGGLVKIRIK